MALVVPFGDKTPKIASDVFLAPTAVVIGDVEIGAGANIWFGVVLRGDVGPIRIGDRTNLQENVVVHLDAGLPAILGDDVTVGHGAIVHGCVVESGSQIGMGAVVLSGAHIGAGSMIAAGAVVPEGARIPAGSVAMGVPAKVRREVTEAEREDLMRRARVYADRGVKYGKLLAGV